MKWTKAKVLERIRARVLRDRRRVAERERANRIARAAVAADARGDRDTAAELALLADHVGEPPPGVRGIRIRFWPSRRTS